MATRNFTSTTAHPVQLVPRSDTATAIDSVTPSNDLATAASESPKPNPHPGLSDEARAFWQKRNPNAPRRDRQFDALFLGLIGGMLVGQVAICSKLITWHAAVMGHDMTAAEQTTQDMLLGFNILYGAMSLREWLQASARRHNALGNAAIAFGFGGMAVAAALMHTQGRFPGVEAMTAATSVAALGIFLDAVNHVVTGNKK